MEILKITSRSASFELSSDNPYYNEKEYDVYLNGKYLFTENRNVFTIFDLEPNEKYIVSIGEEKVEFETLMESLCIHTNSFNPAKDGIKNDTLKIQAAIMACPENGTVYLDEGTYLITSLFFKSNMTFYISKNAKIIGDLDRNNYPVLPGLFKNDKTGFEKNYGTWEGEIEDCFASTLTALDVENLNIIGNGEVDERAYMSDWYHKHREKRIAWRPFGLYIAHSKNINVIGLYIHNSPSWNVHPYFSSNLNFINLRLENPTDMPTTDGLDPDCSNDILIAGVSFKVGDDCIAIKSGALELAKKYKKASENITIRNCLMTAGHGGVVFGSESSAGIKNVEVSKCLFLDLDRGLRIKTRRGRGRVGIIDNVSFKNIKMDNVLTPFVVNMFYNMGPAGGHEEYAWTKEKLPIDERTPKIGSFHFENMNCTNVSLAAAVFLGLPEEPIEGISFENVSFSYKEDAVEGYPVMVEHKVKMLKKGIYAENINEIKLKNVKFTGNIGEDVTGDGIGDIKRI